MKIHANDKQRTNRALEVFLGTGRTFSSYLATDNHKKDIRYIKIGLNTDRNILYERINRRVDIMMDMGLITKPISFLKSKEHLWFKMWLWLTWKNAGWAAIMYLAAISGIDEQMIEAAKVDGATRMQIIWHITIPSLLPTYFVIVMLNLANFLSNGMEQYYVFQNAFNKDWIEVLDLYVYNLSTSGTGMYPLSTAISILKSVVSVALLFVTNTASKLVRGEGFI